MNEASTRAELIDPKLLASGWSVVEGSKVLREYNITAGRIQTGGRGKKLTADYVLVYKGVKLAVIEAKSDEYEVGEGVAQAKQYALKLELETTYASNGKEIYQMCLRTGHEGFVSKFLTPDELWQKTFSNDNEWRDKFSSVPYQDKSGTWQPRFYQEIAVRNTLEAIANSRDRILLTLATGTGKTAIAFQISWKLFQSRWNLKRDGLRRPRILFLADRNILANQAYNAFSAFPEDALVRIKPNEIRKRGGVPTNGSIFFTIFQTFMTGTNDNGEPEPYFGEYPPDYFDLIIIDECHRGGANDESNWRGILEYFFPAVQLGLTATPKRKDNVDTYKYFGEPVYVYSLKEGINDGYLTPFKVKRIKTTLDDYRYTSDDQIIEGEVEEGRLYQEPDFNKIIEIREREAKRVKVYMDDADQNEKAIIFCATQEHAGGVRDLINQYKKSTHPDYCVRVTANDGEIGEQFLREFQDNEKTIPTILTTSQKLSTGVDALNIRNIVLMRPVNSMIEFKQIVGRGTRLFEGKEFFTIYDFVDAYKHFSDPEWDGEPEEPMTKTGGGGSGGRKEARPGDDPEAPKKVKTKIKLRSGKELEIQHMTSTSYWSADGRPISVQEFIDNLCGALPNFFKNEEGLREIWSKPSTRKVFLDSLADAGYHREILSSLQKLVNAEKSDLLDVLQFLYYEVPPITRQDRAESAQTKMFSSLNEKQKSFLEFVLGKYIETGVDELDEEKLPLLLVLKYQSISDAVDTLGDVKSIRGTFIEFQRHLYQSSFINTVNG
jgi:type I restriction enzyme, R subunit